MHFHRRLVVALALLCSPRLTHAAIEYNNVHVIRFSSSTVDSRVRVSSSLVFSEEGLIEHEDADINGYNWIEVGPVSGDGVGAFPPAVSFTVTLKGRFADSGSFPNDLYLRYSSDGKHWTSWQPFSDVHGSTGPVTSRQFQAVASIPQLQRNRFESYRQEWRSTNRAEDERGLVPWIKQRDPSFFDNEQPYIDSFEIRMEGPHSWGEREGNYLQEASIRVSWIVGGFRRLFK